MNIPFSERIIRFIIWGVLSVIGIFIIYAILVAKGAHTEGGGVNFGAIFIYMSMVWLLLPAIIAELLQKLNSWQMVIGNTALVLLTSLLLYAMARAESGYGGLFLMFFVMWFAILSPVVLINSIIVRMHYVSCRKEQQNKNSNEQITTEEQPFRQPENNISS
ncbi:MAG: hypothetical protein IJV35_05155 [Neisseriaceae bacterium]|nr:hypothetical protein [Neisseriaceae bacterium]